MSTSGKSPPSDKRHRPTRVSPRRHVDQSDQPAAGTYDGTEFPVLLRMPDISRPMTPAIERVHGAEGETGQTVVHEPAGGESGSTTERRSRHHHSSTGSEGSKWKRTTDKRSTGNAAARFWSTIPPQVAAGGMLLAVISICFVLLRDSNPPTSAPLTAPEWTAETPAPSDQRLANVREAAAAPVPTLDSSPTAPTEAKSSSESVAIQPVTPKFSVPVPVQPEGGLASQAPVTGWPGGGLGSTEEDTQPVNGWPDLQEDSPSNDAASSPGPIESTARPTLPTLRTSQRTSRTSPTMPEANSDMSDSPRLDGTIEIPSPTKIYRQ
jgi:hypothetical protein